MGKRNQESIFTNRKQRKPSGKLAEYFYASGTSRNGKKPLRASGVDYDSDGGRRQSLDGKQKLMASAGPSVKADSRIKSRYSNVGRVNTGRDRERISPLNCFGDNCVKGTTYYRSNITTAISDLKGVHLTNAHYRLLEGTPFCAFIKATKDLNSNSLSPMMKKNDDAIRCVMSRYDKPSGSFVLGNTKRKPTKRDLASTFGIINGDVQIPPTKDEAPIARPPWLIRCFPGTVQSMNGSWKFSKKNIMDKMQELCHLRDEQSLQDMVRLLHCYALACVFAPLQNAAISSYLAHYVEDLQNINTYDWAGYILAVLFQQINGTRNMKAGGCAIFLLFWLCEQVRLIKPCPVFRQQVPLFLHWDLRDLYAALERRGLDEITTDMLNEVSTNCTTRGPSEPRVVRPCTTAPPPRRIPVETNRQASFSKTGSVSCARFKRKNPRPPGRTIIVSDSEGEEDSDNSNSGEGFVYLGEAAAEGFKTPPTLRCTVINPAKMGSEPVSPRTEEFMDPLDSDGVPRGGVRFHAAHACSPPNFSLSDDEPAVENNKYITELERQMSELQLLVGEKSLEINTLKSVSISECEKNRTELLGLKDLAGKLKVAMTELKLNAESIIEKVAKECTNLARECNRLKCISTGLSAEKRVLLTKVDELEEQKKECSSAGKGYVHDIEKKMDEFALLYAELKGSTRSQLNEARARVILKDKELDTLGGVVKEKDSAIRKLQTDLLAANLKISELVEAEKLHKLEMVGSDEHNQCVNLLTDASLVITEMGEEIENADRTIVEQANVIEQMQLVPFQKPSSSTASGEDKNLGGQEEVASVAETAIRLRRKRNKLTVSPGSITRAIKQRTAFRGRIAKKPHDLFGDVAPIIISDGDDAKKIVVAPESPRPLLYGELPPFDRKHFAVRRLQHATLEVLKDCYADGGPSHQIRFPGRYGLGSVSLEKGIGLLHHEGIDDCMIDGWVETMKQMLVGDPGFATAHIYPARRFGLVNTEPQSKHLKRWVDDEMESALTKDLMLFPLNSHPSIGSFATHGYHWTLLRYNVAKHEWWFYNSLPHPAAGYADVYQAQAKKVVVYVEEAMKKVLRLKNPAHQMFSKGYITCEPAMIETCRQEGPTDCGIVVCNLMEMFIRRKYVQLGTYTTPTVGLYRLKMLEWFLDPDCDLD